MNDYSDIFDYNYTGPKNHTRMPRENRAMQFASFKALSGYDSKLKETRRIVDSKILLDDDKKESINRTLLNLKNNLNDNMIKITYFIKDLKKDGGLYRTINSSVKKIDSYNNELILTNNEKIKIDNILDIEIILND
ncbi:MAG: hypothetical protein IJ068_02510 [Bacilli bacterium]|nr:hypothetical protein [Bacilli bacterium]